MARKLPVPIRAKELVEIFVPSECRCGQPLPEAKRQEVLDEVIDKLTEWFPGATGQKTNAEVKKVDGYWKLVDGSRADEKNDLVYANCSDEQLEEHFEDVALLVHGIAIRLTQEVGACRINGEFFGYEESLKTPHRCAGELPSGALPTPLGSNERKSKRFLQAFLGRVSSFRDIKDLFCKHLNYENKSTELATLDWPESLQDLLANNTLPKVIAGYNGFKIIHLQLAAKDLRKGQERQLIQRIRKDDPTLRALFVVSNYKQNQWHLINTKDTQEDSKTALHLRFFRIGKGQQVRTAAERLYLIDIEALDSEITAQELQDHHNDAFDVESVSQDFFNEISNWYFWALSQVEFPLDTVVDGEDEKQRATSLIRFLTRIIFCWFLKEKGLVPESLFNRKELEAMLVDLEDDHCTYHQGILQNLFFATLNQRMGKDRRFVTGNDEDNKTDLYHYPEHFLDSEKAPGYFKEIPFLNGGLFECLDSEDPDNENQMVRIDGFTTKGTRASIPNILFFTSEEEADLSGKEAFGSAKYKKTKVRGLLNILHSYNFTVEENTPVDEEIALDPELLGKVFENLLASYDEDSSKSARKATGSFYTPRPIVEYMVDESLKGHLVRSLVQGGRDSVSAQSQLAALLSYEDQEIDLSHAEREALLNSIHNCKILDPACGSGAFPMGMLQKLLHIVQKLDDKNEIFERIQIAEAQNITDRDERLKKIEKIGRDFAEDNVNYARKLYLIENCLYGVDIQPIAIQISKLRFFISLICDQKTNKDKGKNHGVEALPNLETKIVAANTLISLPDFSSEDLFLKQFTQPIEKKIEEAYHRYFSVQNRQKKLKIQNELKALREQLGNEILQNIGAQESSSITEKARSIAKWDPFDAQASSDFFDARWMFGESLQGGFNIVIGNPPYGGTKISDGLKNELELGSKDIYGAFISKAFQRHLAPNGLLSFIVSDTFMAIKTHKPLREQILKHKIHKMIRVHPDTFKATVNTAIIILEKQDSGGTSGETATNSCLMADLTNVSIHENFQRFLELLHRTARAGAEDQIYRASAHIMKGEDWWSESSPEYALYSYPQNLILKNSNIPFFVASPKLFCLMRDIGNQNVTNEPDLPSVCFKIVINSKQLDLFKVGDKYTGSGRTRRWRNEGLFQIISGIKTGNNGPYLRILSEEAQKNYELISESKVLSDLDAENLSEEEKLNGIEHEHHYVRFEMGMPSSASDGHLPCYYQKPSLIAIDWSLDGVNGMRNEARSDLANASYRFRALDNQISFSATGIYAPTFRISNAPIFLNKASRIFLSDGYDRNTWLGLLNSRIFRFFAKAIINHGVDLEIDDLKEILVPIDEGNLRELVLAIYDKQKGDPRYDYASNEQIEIDRLVYEAYGLNEDDIREVENWYARRYPALVAAQKANLKKS
jgi:hypothetical protein